jgi:signal transduction histidine kinase
VRPHHRPDHPQAQTLYRVLRHTPKGEITLRSGVSQGQAYLEVEDSGAGLPEHAVEGLGLRVIRAVVRAHGGTLSFSARESDGGGGAQVRHTARLGLPSLEGGANPRRSGS